MKFAKNHPGIILFALSIALGQCFAFRIAPPPISNLDWVLTIFFGFCMIIISIWPSMGLMVIVYKLLGWWDEEEQNA